MAPEVGICGMGGGMGTKKSISVFSPEFRLAAVYKYYYFHFCRVSRIHKTNRKEAI